MKITIYTINNCNFCKQEKEYLTSNKLAFEEKNLETNREFLAEMLKLSNNFAGVPFTLVEKDNAQVVPIKGFTKEEFDTVFGFAAPSVEPVLPATPEVPVVTPEPVVSEVNPVVPEVPTVPEIKPMEPVAPPVSVPEVQPVEPVAPETPVVTPEPVIAQVIPEMPAVPNIPEIKPIEQPVVTPTISMPSPVVAETPVVTPEPVVPVVPQVNPVEPVAPVAPTPVADPNEELKKVIDSLGAMTNEQKPADAKPVVLPGTPSIPDFPTNK